MNMAVSSDQTGSTLYYAINQSCNLRCPFCFARPPTARGGSESKVGPVALHALLRGLKLIGIGCIAITGGEPLLSPALPDILRLATSQSLSIVLITNGTLLTKELARTIQESATVEVCVSFESLNEDVNLIHRTDRAGGRKAVEFLLACGVKVSLSCVLTRQNLVTMPRLLSWAKSLGVEVDLHPVGGLGGRPQMRRRFSLECLDEDQRRQLEETLATAETLFPEMRGYYQALRRMYVYGEGGVGLGGRPCPVPQRSLFLNAAGELRPCFYHPLSFGKVLTDDLVEILERVHAVSQGSDHHFRKCITDACLGLLAEDLALDPDHE